MSEEARRMRELYAARVGSSRWVGPEIECTYCGGLFRQMRNRWVCCSRVCANRANGARTRARLDWATRSSAARVRWMRRHRVGREEYRTTVGAPPRWRRPGAAVQPHPISCMDCQQEFTGKGRRLCGSCSTRRTREGKRRSKVRRRAAKRGIATADRYLASDIYERDGWRCHLCGGRLRRGAVVPHPRAATIDHLVPIAAGGTDTRTNVAAAHFECNWRRRDIGAAQLRWTA